MLRFVDNILNRITMYRLVLYYLIFLLAVALILSAEGFLPYDPFALLFMVGFLIAVCWVTNRIFAWAYRVPTNVESVYISALILALIITPLTSLHDLWFIGWAGVLAMASKYIIAINKKHLFNPVGLSVAITALVLNQTASWWVGSTPMLFFVLVGGLLVVRKLRRFMLVSSFLLVAFLTVVVFTMVQHGDLGVALQNTVLLSPLVFFACIILTEPLTMPPTRRLQLIYGALVGMLFVPEVHLGNFYFTPELAIVIGNLFSYLVSPKFKLILTLKDKIQLAPDIYEFVFSPSQRLAFAPGQYMEWTLGHPDPDSRGNRRFFTLASAPTEQDLRVGVKFYPEPSTYKETLLEMDTSDEIVAAQLAGDFTLPKDTHQKIVLIAGGVGITPFRSMIKYMLDTRQPRPITLIYINRSVDEIVYQDVFDRAQRELRIKTVYTLTDRKHVPASWRGRTGRLTSQMIRDEVRDYHNCLYYISGPNKMVRAAHDLLRRMGIRPDHIKTDYFSGLA